MKVLHLNRLMAIVRLLDPGGPSAIRFAIVAIVIDTLNRGIAFTKLARMNEIARKHVISKCFETRPFHAEASAPVSWEISSFWNIASLKHMAPDPVKTR